LAATVLYEYQNQFLIYLIGYKEFDEYLPN